VSTASEDDERAQRRFRRPSIAKRRGEVAGDDEGEVDEGEGEDDETDAHRRGMKLKCSLRHSSTPRTPVCAVFRVR